MHDGPSDYIKRFFRLIASRMIKLSRVILLFSLAGWEESFGEDSEVTDEIDTNYDNLLPETVVTQVLNDIRNVLHIFFIIFAFSPEGW